MEPEVVDEKLIERYLLGELVGEEQTRLEERLMTDQQFSDSLLEAENELTDDYVRGALHRRTWRWNNSLPASAPATASWPSSLRTNKAAARSWNATWLNRNNRRPASRQRQPESSRSRSCQGW